MRISLDTDGKRDLTAIRGSLVNGHQVMLITHRRGQARCCLPNSKLDGCENEIELNAECAHHLK
jgi:hypothetical protein